MHRFLLAILISTASIPVASAQPQKPAEQDPALKELRADLGKLNPRNEADLTKIFARLDKFTAEHKDNPAIKDIKMLKVQLLRQFQSEESQKMLLALTKDPDPDLAEAASKLVAERKQMAELKSKPIELQFKTASGEEFDLAKWRGKVVLIDFWASWCGPCIQEMPSVVEYYKKMHDKGVEIVGISLDQDKAKMDAAIEKFSMPWPQYFDGQGWKNKYSSQFGINSIPTVWVIDKEGKLRTTTNRLNTVEAQIEEMLKEG